VTGVRSLVVHAFPSSRARKRCFALLATALQALAVVPCCGVVIVAVGAGWSAGGLVRK
jgi:hypothetical protein